MARPISIKPESLIQSNPEAGIKYFTQQCLREGKEPALILWFLEDPFNTVLQEAVQKVGTERVREIVWEIADIAR